MTNSLAELSDTYTNGLIISAGIFFTLFVVRLYFVIKFRKKRKFIFNFKGEWFVFILKFIFALAMIAFLIDVPVWFFTISQFKAVVSPVLNGIFVTVLIAIAVQELILCFTVSEVLIKQFVKRIIFFLVSIFCFLSFGAACFIIPNTYVYPKTEDCVLLDLPVHGTWLAVHAGQEAWVNYHSAYPSQKFAIDMVKLNQDGKYFINQGIECSDFFAFGDSIFAPIGGMVENSASNFATQKVLLDGDTINIAGNFVEIAMNDSQFLFLEHLLSGSVQVKTGDTLKPGQWLGLAGNSGNTTWPHLHMHIQSKPIINDSNSIGLPFRFRKMNRKRWIGFKELSNDYLIRNDQFYSK